MACQDCQDQAKKLGIISAIGGAIAGAGLCFVVLRYARR